MSKCIFLLGLIAITFVIRSDAAGSGTVGSPPGVFCYSDPACDEASKEWSGVCKSGKKQSPIDFPVSVSLVPLLALPLFKAANKPQRQSLTFNNHYSSNSFYTVDNGHTVQIQLEPTATSSAEMTGYELNEPYVFAQAHLHWGNILGGSEHTIGGKHFTGEIHLVHYAKKYGSVAGAVASGDPKGIAVVGVFLEKSLIPSLDQLRGDLAMLPIVANLPTKYDPTAKQVNQPINLGLFLPRSGENVFRYEGSLTTPGCAESVLWTMAEKPLPVSILELGALYNVQDEEGQRLQKNFRSTQPLNGRKPEKFTVA